MPRNQVKRGRRKSVTRDEQERMVRLYEDGHSLKAVARQLGRHWQTVEKYVRKWTADHETEEIRREALKAVLMEHYRDLTRLLEVIQGRFVMPEVKSGEMAITPQQINRRDSLLLKQLREVHAKDSYLWSLWEEWDKQIKAYVEISSNLKQKFTECLADEAGHPELTKVELGENFIKMLFEHAYHKARKSNHVLETGFSIEGGKLYWGKSTQLSTGGCPEAAQTLFHSLAEEMCQWAEFSRLKDLWQSLDSLINEINEELDILILRRAFPGRCRLCPV